jgi:N-methylhydantoinase A
LAAISIRGSTLRLIGIDTGGTFTDFVLFDDGHLRVHKVLSTPGEPEQAILKGIRELGLECDGLRVVHGSTVATNAALEGKGVRTAYITNRGLGDLLTIGRQARRELYNLQPDPQSPPVPRELCIELDCRVSAQGEVLQPLDSLELKRLAERLAELGPRAVAVNLLFSYLNPEAEEAVAAAVHEGVFISLSSRVLPEIREYERGMAAWLNAWVGPLVEGYLNRLEQGLSGARVAVMQSSGDTISAARAGSQAVRMLLSGPAGGLVGARFVGQLAGSERLLTFDMGGTSTDVALIEGEPRLTSEGHIGPYPVAVPMVDMHTIGAGGGSIARVDAGGMLQVGPESAGADPGPACYGGGGTEPAVTDANLVLGRLRPDAFLGGRMRLDEAASRLALEPVALAMNCSIEQAALGVIEVANEHMAQALRVISVQRGVDPRGYSLVSFGGAGGLHVCALADALEMKQAIVPVYAGVLSALGMLATRPGRQLSRTRLGLLAETAPSVIEADLSELRQQGVSELEADGIAAAQIQTQCSLDLRYRGQSYTLNVPWSSREEVVSLFEELHQARYGHRMDVPVELVNLRVSLRGDALDFTLQASTGSGESGPDSSVRLYGVEGDVPVYSREGLAAGQRLHGPALITETVSTTWLAPGWGAQVDGFGSLLLDRQ